jgi:hypothetical protein
MPLQGAIRDHVTRQRRPYIRFFACSEDLSHQSPMPCGPIRRSPAQSRFHRGSHCRWINNWFHPAYYSWDVGTDPRQLTHAAAILANFPSHLQFC